LSAKDCLTAQRNFGAGVITLVAGFAGQGLPRFTGWLGRTINEHLFSAVHCGATLGNGAAVILVILTFIVTYHFSLFTAWWRIALGR